MDSSPSIALSPVLALIQGLAMDLPTGAYYLSERLLGAILTIGLLKKAAVHRTWRLHAENSIYGVATQLNLLEEAGNR